MDATALSALLYRHILDARRTEARELLARAVEASGYEFALRSVLEPSLALLGERWSENSISLAQGFVAGKVAEDFLALGESHWPEAEVTAAGDGGPARIAVMGNIEDDYHAMGRSLVTTFLRLRGWTVADLGCDILAASFVDKAIEVGACVIGVSAMMLTTARNVLSLRAELDGRGLSGRIKLAVGGRRIQDAA